MQMFCKYIHLLIVYNFVISSTVKFAMHIICFAVIPSIVCQVFFPSNCRYVNMTQDLQRVNLLELSENEKLAFFLNLYNAMVIHAVISVGCPEGVIDRRSFFSDFQYVVGGHPYSLNSIKNGILRCNRRSPYSLVKPFSTGDKRLEVK